jgi:transcriptional regulator MraZ
MDGQEGAVIAPGGGLQACFTRCHETPESQDSDSGGRGPSELGSGFKGQYSAQVDNKQRVAVPAKLRRNVPGGAADQFVITLGLDGCLFLFPPEKWDQIVSRLQESSFTTEKAKFFWRVLAAHAEDVELDGQSRILLPARLIARAGIKKEVTFVGAINRIEIWHPETFDKYVREQPDSYEKVAADYLL